VDGSIRGASGDTYGEWIVSRIRVRWSIVIGILGVLIVVLAGCSGETTEGYITLLRIVVETFDLEYFFCMSFLV
jgi:hypothetical protein